MKRENVFTGIAAFIFAYCALRAFQLSMTHDESSTALVFVSRPWQSIFANDPPSANNHILNTLLIKLFTLGGLNKFLLRLPNLLAGGLYLYYAFRFIRLLDRSWAGYALGFAVLLFNQYLLEFFSLGRGYGLSIGFLMGSLYYAYRFQKGLSLKHLSWSALFGLLACYSNLTLLNYFVALIGAVNLLLLLQPGSPKWGRWAKANGLMLAVTAIMAALLYKPVSNNIRQGEFYFGGQNGFFADTFTSLVEAYAGQKQHFGPETVSIFISLAFILLCLAVSRNLYETIARRRMEAGAFFTIILLLMAMSNIVQHHWLETRFLVSRTALLYYPVSGLCLLFLFRGSPPWAKWALIVPVMAHFLSMANVDYVREWWYDRSTEKVMAYITDQHEGQEPVRIGANWIFTPSMSYYIKAWGIQYFIGPNRDEVPPADKYYDYYYLWHEDAGKLHPDYLLEKDFGGYYLMKLPPEKRPEQAESE